MKMTAEQTKQFWFLAHCWASSTLDTPKRATLLLDFVEGLMDGPAVKPPPEGILHRAMGNQAAVDAAEALAVIEEQQRKRERRLAAEQRREDDRRKVAP